MTLLDNYTLLTIGAVGVVLFMHAVCGLLLFDCDTITGNCTFRAVVSNMDDMYNFDRTCFYTLLSLWFTFNVIYLVRAVTFVRAVRSKITPEASKRLGFQDAAFIKRRTPWWDPNPRRLLLSMGGVGDELEEFRDAVKEKLKWLDLEA